MEPANDDEAGRFAEGSRFAHLLKPIRDLADNWGIDIANDLEDYLAHLNRTVFTFEGHSGPTLDFAEAALLIQSSACVYSRKVDFLHTLVFQALEVVRNKKARTDGVDDALDSQAANATQKERVARRNAANAGDHGLGELDDDIDNFLSIGLDLKMADDIDLSMDEETTLQTYSRPPAALLALEDHGNGTGDGDAGFFRLAQCYVHVSGVLLLDANDAELYDANLNNTGIHSAMENRRPCLEGIGIHGTQGVTGLATQQTQQQQHLNNKSANGDDDDDDDHGGNNAGGMSDDEDAVAVTNNAAAPAATSNAIPQGPTISAAANGQLPSASVIAVTTINNQQDAATSGQTAAGVPNQDANNTGEDATARHTTAGNRRVTFGVGRAEQGVSQGFDPWTPLDPDQPGDLPIRPMQVRRPNRSAFKPVVVNQQATDTVGRSAQRALAASLSHPEFAYGVELVEHLNPQPLKPPRGSRKVPALAHDQAGIAVLDADDVAAVAQAQQDALELEEATQYPPNLPVDDVDDHDGDMGGAAVGFDDDDHVDAYGSGGLDVMNLLQGISAGAGIDTFNGMDMLNSGDDHDHHDSSTGPSYEELCRAHMEAMMAAAAAQEKQTELAMRVTGWRTKIDPVLKEEETRKGYDIQQYQHRIIQRLDKQTKEAAAVDENINFGSVAAQHDKWEVSRVFAAMLQLINNRNIALVKTGPPDAPFTLQLLDSQLTYHKMGKHLDGVQGTVTSEHGGEQPMDVNHQDNGVLHDLASQNENDSQENDMEEGSNDDDIDVTPAASRRKKSQKGQQKAAGKPMKGAKTRPAKKVKAIDM